MTDGLATFVLVFARVAALASALPVFGVLGVPRWSAALLALATSALLAGNLGPVAAPDLAALLLGVASEVLTGAAMGFGVAAAFGSLAVGMDLAANQMGLSFAAMVDPFTRAHEPVIATLAGWLAGALFVAGDLHGRSLVLVAASFDAVPPGAGASLAPRAAIDAVAGCLALGIQLGAPVVAVVWVANLVLALLARLAPRMNAFFAIGHPVTTTVGTAVLGASLPWILVVHHQAVRAALERIGAP